MDKQWIGLQNPCKRYVDGVDSFLKYAFSNVDPSTSEILCPCVNCYNLLHQNFATVQWHCIEFGFAPDYTTWVFHGEKEAPEEPVNNVRDRDEDAQENEIPDMVNDIFLNSDDNYGVYGKKFEMYMNSANSPLYSGCKTETTLSFVVWLFNLKCNAKWSDWSFDSLLGKLKEVLPKCTNMPSNFYETKKMVGELGFDYEKIDVCPNDCMLYWKEDKELKSCKVCNNPRWKTVHVETKDDETPTKENKVAVKQLRYLPLIPRLQRLFRSSKTALDMKWHHTKRRKDGVYRHPADSYAWKHFDMTYRTFGEECRNVRLGLSTDGMNPFNNGHYSIWPVQVVVYNLPPWMCLKQEHIIMPLLIPGPCSPSNDIDVYLQPLIDELNTLWSDGVNTYDASTKSFFKMHAALLWTVSDFPALANLSGWSTKGKLACPICQGSTRSLSLRSKQCYIGHRCFLPPDHKYRYDKKRFNGEVDFTEAPPVPSGYDVLEQVSGMNVTFGKAKKKTVHEKSHNWRKKSIFFQLPYWRTLLVRHMLDLMHIEKNVCDNLIGTLLGMRGKSKDTLKARLDLEDMRIRKELHAKPIDLSCSAYQLPAACYTLSKKEKQSFLEVLKGIKVPDGYSSNISRCINIKECKITGLKSHDCHILMQQLLPIVMRSTPLPEHVKRAIIDFCHFFRELCSNHYREEDYERMNRKIPLILCNLEMVFPPAFFDIMVHLLVHLAEQQRVAGNVKFLNMYPFERSMRKTKGYIRNRSRPEGSIAEGVVAEECLTFCSRYLKDVDSTCAQDRRNDDGYDEHGSSIPIFRRIGRFLWTPKIFFIDDEKVLDMAHLYVLFNCEEVHDYISIWEKSYRMQQGRRRKISARDIDNAKKKEFPRWFREYGKEMDLSEDIKALSRGPIKIAYRGTGYLVNGFRFHTEKREKKSQTQNSGVYVAATTRGYSSARDSNPREEIVEYFGILEDIIELNYNGDHKVVLFKCRWYDSIARDKGVKTDQYGYTLVHSNKFGSKEEPFVLPSQVEQLFYVDDHRDKDWRVVIRTKPRDMCDSAEAEVDTDDLTLQVSNSANTVTENEEDNYIWARENIDPEVVDEGTRGSRIKKRKHDATKKQKVDSFMVDEELNEDDVLISEDEEEWLDEEDEDEREEDEDEEYEED